MVAYQDFVALSESQDSEQRGMAAHLAAMAYLGHDGPAEEQAALYAALIGFLDDPSVKVRAALAYGLLHAENAPRAILLSLLRDSAVISRAVVQYSPALLDADILSVIRDAELSMLTAVAMRDRLSQRVADALVARGERTITLKILAREDVSLSPDTLLMLTDKAGADDPAIRGALLERQDLPAAARLQLVQAATAALVGIRIVKGAVAAHRLERIVRDGTDTALTSIGERYAADGGSEFASLLIAAERVSTRVMLHSIVNGHVLFFADCLAALSEVPREKVFTILETGSRPALNALLARCGLGEAVRNLVARLIFHARSADLADDVTARHYVITALTEELIVDYDGNIPIELEEAFSYLSEQNVILARKAARGVMSAFAGDLLKGPEPMPLPPVDAAPVAAITNGSEEAVVDVIADFVPASELEEPHSAIEVTLDDTGDAEVPVVALETGEPIAVEAQEEIASESAGEKVAAAESDETAEEALEEPEVAEADEDEVESDEDAEDEAEDDASDEGAIIEVEADIEEDLGVGDAEDIIARAVDRLTELEAKLNADERARAEVLISRAIDRLTELEASLDADNEDGDEEAEAPPAQSAA